MTHVLWKGEIRLWSITLTHWLQGGGRYHQESKGGYQQTTKRGGGSGCQIKDEDWEGRVGRSVQRYNFFTNSQAWRVQLCYNCISKLFSRTVKYSRKNHANLDIMIGNSSGASHVQWQWQWWWWWKQNVSKPAPKEAPLPAARGSGAILKSLSSFLGW